MPDLLESSIKLHGYKLFRKFKEQSSYALSNNAKVIIGGGNLQSLTFDMKTGARATAYPENGNFDSEVYLNEIADEYLSNMCAAIRTVLKYCDVREEDIDCVVASGGGNKIFGISKLLKGEELPKVDEPLHFAKVQANPQMYIENGKFSSALCAIGSAWPLPQIKFKNACPCEYFFKLNVYRADRGEVDGWENKTFDIELPDMSGFQMPATFQEQTFTFAKKDEPLPTKPPRSKKYDIKDLFVLDGQVFIILLSLWSRTEDAEHFQKGWSTCSSRTWGNAIGQTLRGGANSLIGAINDFFGTNIDEFDDYSTVKATFVVNTEVTEDFMIKLTPRFDIEGQTDINESGIRAN